MPIIVERRQQRAKGRSAVRDALQTLAAGALPSPRPAGRRLVWRLAVDQWKAAWLKDVGLTVGGGVLALIVLLATAGKVTWSTAAPVAVMALIFVGLFLRHLLHASREVHRRTEDAVSRLQEERNDLEREHAKATARVDDLTNELRTTTARLEHQVQLELHRTTEQSERANRLEQRMRELESEMTTYRAQVAIVRGLDDAASKLGSVWHSAGRAVHDYESVPPEAPAGYVRPEEERPDLNGLVKQAQEVLAHASETVVKNAGAAAFEPGPAAYWRAWGNELIDAPMHDVVDALKAQAEAVAAHADEYRRRLWR